MQAKTWALGEILKPERRYIIPTFQRSYEWTKDGQWELLFEDLIATADRLFQRRQYAKMTESQPDEASVSPHFLGAIVYDSLPYPAGGVALRSVIDGQQRLTTLQLLLRGLLNMVQEEESEGELKGKAKSLFKMISNDEDSGASPEDVYKLWPRRDDRELWPSVISDKVPAYDKHDHLYLQARNYFAEATRTSLTEIDGDERVERLRALVDAADTLLQARRHRLGEERRCPSHLRGSQRPTDEVVCVGSRQEPHLPSRRVCSRGSTRGALRRLLGGL